MKLAIFDLDGVLVRTEHMHTFSFKEAIAYYAPQASGANYLDARDGIRTKDKLARIQHDFNLTDSIIEKIDRRKQALTEQHLRHIRPNSAITSCLQKLKDNEYTIALASNSRRSNVNIVIQSLDLVRFFEFIITGDDVRSPKPSPEIFNKVIHHFNVIPTETIIFEDSEAGKEAGVASGATVCVVDPNELVTINQVDLMMRIHK